MLTFSELGDCLGWLLTPEKDFFLRKPESVLPTSFISLVASGADDFLADMFSEGTSRSTGGRGKCQLGSCAGHQFCFSGLACWDYFISAC